MNSDAKSIERAIKEGYSLKTGQYIKQGWDIVTKNGAAFIGFLFVVIIINSALIWLESLEPRIIPVRILINPPLVAGFYIPALKILKNESVSFADFFKSFEKIVQLNLMNIVTIIILIIGFLLLIIPGIYLSVAYGLALPIFLDNPINFWAAMENSRKIVSKHWFGFFWFGLQLTLINLLGAILFGVGLLLTIPLSFCAITAAYEDIVRVRTAND